MVVINRDHALGRRPGLPKQYRNATAQDQTEDAFRGAGEQQRKIGAGQGRGRDGIGSQPVRASSPAPYCRISPSATASLPQRLVRVAMKRSTIAGTIRIIAR